ncbi:hypothetical protein Rhe02_54130 [Rhizocola hellebori]|uniref:HNH endonuclease n=1 Tax=Rhizocola hellebori TaxID=1392758 RepID=A0A8J3VIS0_9ACTN|nr:hypothetical protein Rhe02_54130 [Rhizocola hellebori]
MIVTEASIERFMAKVVKQQNGCWRWTAYARAGYGQLSCDSKRISAHRFSYMQFVGPIPDGLTIDHVCHTRDLSCRGGETCPHRRCVNPAHLEAVTQAVNGSRGRAGKLNNPMRDKTHCPQGHPYDLANTYLYFRKRKGCVGRECRPCRNEAVLRHKLRHGHVRSGDSPQDQSP